MVSNKVQNLGMIPFFTLEEEATKRAESNLTTDLYSFGDQIIDDYCGGGWGRHDAYELICVFGGTGMNKSTLMSQMALSAAFKGAKVAYLALEDEAVDVVIRMRKQMGLKPDGTAKGMADQQRADIIRKNIRFFPENDGYSLSEMAKTIEELFKTYDVVMVDPIQFVFEASVVESGESEFNRQRLFMRELRNIVVKAKKPLVFVSHTNKSAYNKKSDVDGLGQMLGSSQLPQICSKIVQINRDEDGLRSLKLLKTRFTRNRYNKLQVNLDPDKLRIYFDPAGLTQQQIMDMKANW